VLFQLDGEEFLALNGGPHFKFSPAISFIANCGTQKEIDELWKKLSEGGNRTMRLAQGQIRRFVADRSRGHRQDDARQGRSENGSRDAGHSANEQNRDQKAEGGL